MAPYPPGVSAGTPNAPWNQEPAEKCDECGGRYREGGHETVGGDEEWICVPGEHYFTEQTDGDPPEECPECGAYEITGLPCPHDGVGMAELEEQRRAEHQEDRFDRSYGP